jgi:hypothetical protein
MVRESVACGHIYHPVCIERWLAVKDECPICKAPLGVYRVDNYVEQELEAERPVFDPPLDPVDPGMDLEEGIPEMAANLPVFIRRLNRLRAVLPVVPERPFDYDPDEEEDEEE